MGEEYTLQEESDYHLINTLAILELNCDLPCPNISAARGVLNRFFSHFFPKQMQPDIFSEVVQRFQMKDDLVLADRQASLKIGVEATIAFVAASGQEVDWVKAGTAAGINKEKWKTLVKDAKP
jgi:hypothetical protein